MFAKLPSEHLLRGGIQRHSDWLDAEPLLLPQRCFQPVVRRPRFFWTRIWG